MVGQVEGTVHLLDGNTQPVSRQSLLSVSERSLKLLALCMVLLAVALVAWRLAL